MTLTEKIREHLAGASVPQQSADIAEAVVADSLDVLGELLDLEKQGLVVLVSERTSGATRWRLA